MTVYKEIVAEQRLTNIECTCVILRLSRRIIFKLWLDNHSYVKLRNQWTNGKTLSTEALRRSLACFSFIQQIFQFAKHRYGDHCKLIAVLLKTVTWQRSHHNTTSSSLLRAVALQYSLKVYHCGIANVDHLLPQRHGRVFSSANPISFYIIDR